MNKEAGRSSYGKGITPWHLCEHMQSSGNAHVDALRCDVIEYAFRKKGDEAKMIDDLEKAAHCATRAAEVLRKRLAEKQQPEFPQLNREASRKSVNGHRLMLPTDCKHGPDNLTSCAICDGGLAVCLDCGKAEAELDKPCLATDGGGS
jgi:hypothetical protein